MVHYLFPRSLLSQKIVLGVLKHLLPDTMSQVPFLRVVEEELVPMDIQGETVTLKMEPVWTLVIQSKSMADPYSLVTLYSGIIGKR